MGRKKYDIQIPTSEVNLLAMQLSGKCKVDMLEVDVKKDITKNIKEILMLIDKEFKTNTAEDLELIDALVIHVIPLLNRICNNIQLANPIVDDVYTEYANVFLLAIRFRDMLYEKYNYLISIDETGYIALYFAAHFERVKNSILSSFKRIIIICETGAGSAQLIRCKLESIFPKAVIVTTSINELKSSILNQGDLILTTIPINFDYGDTPVIQIKEWFNHSEIKRIENIILQSAEMNELNIHVNNIMNLFFESLFLRHHNVDYVDYIELLKQMGNKMIEEGYAEENYVDLILERESKFPTIYKNGVAGPHPIYFNAKQDSICISVLDHPMQWKGLQIRLIFMINLKKGHLFLHKEISNLLLKIMEDDFALKAILKATDFKQFCFEINKLVDD